MRSETPFAGSPRDWLRHARSDLVLARTLKTPRVLYEHLCFHAQQAAGKAVKAILVRRGIVIPKTHDLAFLLGLLPSAIQVPVALIDLPILTKYAVQLRYPAETHPATANERRTALRLAQAAVEWAEKELTAAGTQIH